MGKASVKHLLQIENLSKTFPITNTNSLFRKEKVKAVENVSFNIQEGKTVGLVGESGSGKTTIGRMIIRLLQPDNGRILFEEHDLASMNRKEFRAMQPKIQMVFQDPYSTLNPRLTLKQIIQEPMKLNAKLLNEDIDERTHRLMKVVGLNENQLDRFAHEFSGGQRQRIAICRALALNPQLIVCDEAVSALDVSIQAKILNLLMDLQQKLNPAYLFISHDLSVVRLVSDTIVVLYLGKVMEIGPAAELTDNPLHPYTKALMSAVPDPYSRNRIKILKGEIPGNIKPPSGCRFHTRCSKAFERCKSKIPALVEISSDRKTACFLHHNKEEKQF